MADALGIPVYGACSLDALATRHDDGAPFAVCTDARRRQVYWARYDETGHRVDGPDLAPAAVVADQLDPASVHVLGAGVALYRTAFDGFHVHDEPAYAAAADVARLVAGRAVAGAGSDVMEPLYLRRPDATPPGAPKPVTAR
jgi:tRNA threonylcarbamoyl adenosine modification protein YeaZ